MWPAEILAANPNYLGKTLFDVLFRNGSVLRPLVLKGLLISPRRETTDLRALIDAPGTCVFRMHEDAGRTPCRVRENSLFMHSGDSLPSRPMYESPESRTYTDSFLSSIVLLAIAHVCNVDDGPVWRP